MTCRLVLLDPTSAFGLLEYDFEVLARDERGILPEYPFTFGSTFFLTDHVVTEPQLP